MNTDRIDLNLLRVLVAVYEEGSLTGATERLLMTQPGLSHALRRARETLGDELFVRTPQGMEPTPFTEAHYPAIRDGLSRLDQALQFDTKFNPAISNRLFRLGVNDYGSMIVMPPVLRRVSREAGGIQLRSRHLPTHQQIEAILARKLDAAIGVYDKVPNAFGVLPLFTEDAVGIISAQNTRTIDDGIGLQAYADAQHVIMAPEGGSRSWVDDALAQQGLRRTVAHVVPHFAALFVMIPGTDYVSTVPRRLVGILGENSALCVFELPFPAKLHQISLVWHYRDHGDPGHAWFRQKISEAVESLVIS